MTAHDMENIPDLDPIGKARRVTAAEAYAASMQLSPEEVSHHRHARVFNAALDAIEDQGKRRAFLPSDIPELYTMLAAIDRIATNQI